jgi:hypothetical protein
LAKAAWRGSDKRYAIATLNALSNDDNNAGSEAAVSLAKLGHRHDQLVARLDSGDYYRRLNAALALAYLSDHNNVDRLIGMQREAATPFERVYLAAALALLGKPNGAAELNKELIEGAASPDYFRRVDIFFVHRYLQTAIIDGFAAGGADYSELHSAWRAELEPLEPIPKPSQLQRSQTSSAEMASRGIQGTARPLNVFISYSHQDERMRLKLRHHLATLVSDGLIRIWHDREIEAGANWEGEINKEIGAADVILLLVSASFLNSNYCRKELLSAMEQRGAGKSLPIPIILRPCDWESVFNRPEFKAQALPRDNNPVAGGRWRNQDAAFAAITQELRTKIERMRH